MNIEAIIYLIFIIIIVTLLFIISISILSKKDYYMKYYDYNIKYDTVLDRNYSIIKRQKKMILKKEIYILYLRVLLKLKRK